jgi:hypothetical protein
MSEKEPPQKIVDAIFDLLKDEREKSSNQNGGELDSKLSMLRTWQVERLTRTYRDLLADKRYAPACDFFLSDIYAAKDFSQRDQDVQQIFASLTRYLPAQMLAILRDTITLNQLTEDLDERILHVLVAEFGVTNSISEEQYAEAYRLCDNYRERKSQIDLIVSILQRVEIGARLPFVGMTIRLTRTPARRAGWGELHDTLERGYSAFKRAHKVQWVIELIKVREQTILDRIYAHDPEPFSI